MVFRDPVHFPRISEEMHDGEDGHLDADEEGRESDFQVAVGDCVGGFEDGGRGEDGDGDLYMKCS